MKKNEADVQYGGQAVFEGVMMRGRHYLAVAVRKSDGRILTKVETVSSVSRKIFFLKWPFFRGMLAFFESLVVGVKTLYYSANEYLEDLEKEEAEKNKAKGKQSTKKETAGQSGLGFWDIFATMAFTLGAFALLFVILPDLFTRFLEGIFRQGSGFWASEIVKNSVEGLLRLVIMVVYILAISFLKDIKRFFAYHGAEHKTIFTYESKEELNLENARVKTTLHPRCGTSFLFYVVLVSFLVYALIPFQHNVLLRFLIKLPLLLPIAGISYELIKAAGKKQAFFLIRWLSWPGLMLQKITTREPDDQQIEVALAALKEVLAAEAAMDSKVIPVTAKKVESIA